jgi:DNA-binding XRE family transcriptional regulator
MTLPTQKRSTFVNLPTVGWWPCERCGDSPWPAQCTLTAFGYMCALCRGDSVPLVSLARPKPSSKVVEVTTYIPMRIRTARRNANLTVVDVAKRVGVTCGAVDRWEAGTRRPDPALLCAIAGAIGCSVGTFFGEDRKIA